MRIFSAAIGATFAAFVTFEATGFTKESSCFVFGRSSSKRVGGGLEWASHLMLIPIEVGARGTPPRLMWHLRRERATTYFANSRTSRSVSSWYAACKDAFVTDPYVSSAQTA